MRSDRAGGEAVDGRPCDAGRRLRHRGDCRVQRAGVVVKKKRADALSALRPTKQPNGDSFQAVCDGINGVVCGLTTCRLSTSVRKTASGRNCASWWRGSGMTRVTIHAVSVGRGRWSPLVIVPMS